MFNKYFRENLDFFQYEISSYIGGKSRMKKFIHPEIERANRILPVKTLSEPFSGMYWITLLLLRDNPILRYENVVFNDYNSVQANLFACLKHPDFLSFLNYMKKGNIPNDERILRIYEKELLESGLRVQLNKDYPDMITGYKYLYILNHARNGIINKRNSFNRNLKSGGAIGKVMRKLNNPKWQRALKGITHIGCEDYKLIFNRFDSANTLFYVDPPYFGKENYYRNHHFCKDNHVELAEVLHNIQGRFILSYYDFPELERYYPKSKYRWESREFRRPSSNSGKKGEEIIIMNY